MIDTHCHLDHLLNEKDLFGAMLQRAKEQNLRRAIVVGTQPEDWKLYKNLVEQDSFFSYTLGLHPLYVGRGWENDLQALESLLQKEPLPVAIGEIGLDLATKHQSASVELQEEVLCAQLKLAQRYQLPVVIHSRDAFDRIFPLLDKHIEAEKVLFHCFTGGKKEMQWVLERQMHASFTGIVTYRKAESVREALRLLGPERLILETDAPYLSPEPHRSKENEPAFLRATLQFCAQFFGIEEFLLEEYTDRNAQSFFR